MNCPTCGRMMGKSVNNSLLVAAWEAAEYMLHPFEKSHGKLKEWVCSQEDYYPSSRKWKHH